MTSNPTTQVTTINILVYFLSEIFFLCLTHYFLYIKGLTLCK